MIRKISQDGAPSVAHILRHSRFGRFYFDKPDDGRGGALPEAEFQKKVLDSAKEVQTSVKTLEQKNADLLKNYENLDKDTKKAIEDLTTVKNEFGTMSEKLNALQKVHLQLSNERKAAYGDPIARLLADPERKAHVNAVVRKGLESLLTEAHKKALGEDSSPGSTLITPQMAQDIYDLLPEFGIWPTLGQENMGTKLENMPIDTADPVCNVILTEGGTIADDTNMTGATVQLQAKVLAVLVNISNQLLQDAEYDVSGRVMKKFMRAVSRTMDYLAFLANGTADATNGGFTGLFNFGTAVTAASTHTKVELMSFEDITAVLLGADVAVASRSPRWWIHPYILIRMLSIKDGNGRPIFLTALEAPAAGSIGSILGYPVTNGNILPSANSAGSAVASFGDPEAYVVGRRMDVNFDFSDHARWTTWERSFRAIARAGFKGRIATGITVLKTSAS